MRTSTQSSSGSSSVGTPTAETGRRAAGSSATQYTITPEGRAALKEWFGTEPAAPLLEVEGFLRMFLGDQATKDELRDALDATAHQARELTPRASAHRRTAGHGRAVPAAASPHRTDRSTFIADFYRDLIEWCEQTISEIDEWPDTRDIGLTPKRPQAVAADPGPQPDP